MILVWLFLIPTLGGLLAWGGERYGSGIPRWVSLLSITSVFVLSLLLWQQGDYSLGQGVSAQPQWQLEFQAPWISRFGISFHFALDGLSLVMVMLTAFIGILSVVCSWREINRHVGFFHFNLLLLLSGVIGVFLAIDLFLFFFFWEMMLIPMYFLISLWGHKGAKGSSRIQAAIKFFIFTQAGGLLMLLAILGLVLTHYSVSGELSFDYEVLRHAILAPELEYALMLGFFMAFAVKLPIVPLHSWLPDAHSQAPTAGSVDLAGLLLKTAAYGLLRFVLPMFPNASHEFAPIAIGLALVGIIYGAVLAFSQHDIKRMVAYTSISHMGFVLIGIYAGSTVSLQGVVVQMVAHGLSAAALFILCGMLYERLHTRDLRQMGGLWSRLPLLPAVALFFAAASLGIPGTGNFIGEFLILLGSYQAAPYAVMAATGGLVLASIYSLRLVQRAFFGPAQSSEPIEAAIGRETVMLLGLVVLTLWIGFYPQPLLNTSAAAIGQVQQIYAAAIQAAEAAAP